MNLHWEPGLPLSALRDGGPGFIRWVSAAPDGGPGVASNATRLALTAQPGSRHCQWPASLAAGSRDVVVTGQQPGFLGGPLLTLHKVAAAIALAELRTAAGRPTIAVFWCGDDDDDLTEALGPVGWDPVAEALVRADGRAAARSGRFERRMVGTTSVRRWCGPGEILLRRLAGQGTGGSLAADLAGLWSEALADDWDWTRLNVAAVGRIFRGHDLVIVRGGDPDLHAAAAPFYAEVAGRRARCRELVRARGQVLAAAGETVALSDRSLHRHLFVDEDGRRVYVPESGPLPPASRLRPGVMLRSLVQDWLLQPIGVVIGPGEAAYLRQLEPLYPELGVTRSPLVPRLFAWILPTDFPAAALADFAAGPRLGPAQVESVAGSLAATAAAEVKAALVEHLGLDASRAESLARGRSRRWRRGVAAMLRAESERAWARAHADWPGWLAPEGRRQERRLAAAATAALVGDGLPGALVSAAKAHLVAGADGCWNEYLVR